MPLLNGFTPVCSMMSCTSARSSRASRAKAAYFRRLQGRVAFCEEIALPSTVFGPVDFSHGRVRRSNSACFALRSGVHPLVVPMSFNSSFGSFWHPLTDGGAIDPAVWRAGRQPFSGYWWVSSRQTPLRTPAFDLEPGVLRRWKRRVDEVAAAGRPVAELHPVALGLVRPNARLN